MDSPEALRTIAAFRLALPRTILRYAGGRELTLGDLGTRDGLLGGINAVIVGNYLTTLGRDPEEDLAPARGPQDADQGAQQQPVTRETIPASAPFCGHCGESRDAGGHEACDQRLRMEPPRFCSRCRRRMVVQVTPTAWTARCIGARRARPRR